MASIVPQPRPAHVAMNVPSPVRRASSHSSVTTLNSLKNAKSSATPPPTASGTATTAGITSTAAPATATSTTTTTTTTPSGAKLTSPSHSQSSASSETGGSLPGAFPRDPRAALEHLNEKAAVSSGTQSTADNGTILGAAREDLRHAVDVAAQYLPETVVGALGSVLAVGAMNSEETEKKLDAGETSPTHVSREVQTSKDVAVGGIASDFNPSSSKSRAVPSSVADAGATASKSQPLTSPSVARALDSTAPAPNTASKSVSTSNDVPLVAPTAVPASKEKKDDDVQGVTSKQPQSSDLRKKAMEAAALGAGAGVGAGALGGAAFANEKAKTSSKVNPQVGDLSSSDAPSVSRAPGIAALPASDNSANPTSEWGTRGRSDAQKALDPHQITSTTKDGDKKKAVQAAALGAGIGTIGGTTYSHAQSQTQEAVSKENNSCSAGGRLAEDQPAFVYYAPAPVITEDYTPDVPEDEDEVPPTSSVRDEKRLSTSDAQESLNKEDSSESPTAKKGLGVAALGAGAGALGGAAYQHSRSRENDNQKGDIAGSPAGYADNKNLQKQMSQLDKDAANAANTGIGAEKKTSAPTETMATEVPPTVEGDAEKVADKDVSAGDTTTTDSKEKKVVVGAAFGAGAGVAGSAAYRYLYGVKEKDSVAATPSPLTQAPSAKSALLTKPRDGEKSTQAFGKDKDVPTSEGSTPEQSSKSAGESSESSSDSKTKKGFWAAALGAGAGVFSGAAFQHSKRKSGSGNGEETGKSLSAEKEEEQPRTTQTTPGTSQPLPASQSQATTDQTTGAARQFDAKDISPSQSATGKDVATTGVGAGAGTIGAAFVADKKPLNDQPLTHGTEKSQEQVKKDAMTTSAAGTEAKDESKGKKLAAGAAGATAVGAGAGLAENKLQDGKKPQPEHLAKDASKSKTQAPQTQQASKEVKQVQPQPEQTEMSKESDKAKKLAAGVVGGTAAGAGAGLAANSLADGKKHQPSDEFPSATQPSAQSAAPAHPSIKAASSPPQRPAPIAHGAAGPNDKPMSGVDSDFPLPSANASSTEVVKAVDIDGSGAPSDNRGKSNTAAANTAAGVVTAGAASTAGVAGAGAGTGARPVLIGRGERSAYHEGVQEKYDGGLLRSSTVERKRDSGGSAISGGSGNGTGKKEGFVRHLVEKVKDKLHHHDKEKTA